MVLWSIAIAAIIVAATQLLTWRTAVLGRSALARVQARWAARAGVEQVITTLGWHTEDPDPEDPMALFRDLEDDAIGDLETGSWDIRHVNEEGIEIRGPLDEHARINLNVITKLQLAEFDKMGLDTVDAITDWIDEDDEVQGLGAESNFYDGRDMGYRPRNAAFKTIPELELVAGAFAEYVRGEDWNLNNRIDPNEDDGNDSVPPDNADGVLQGGWASLLTTRSKMTPLSMSGFPRIDLRVATPEELTETLDISQAQAEALIQWGQTSGAQLGALLTVDLADLAGGGQSNTQSSSRRTTGRSSRSSRQQEEDAVAPLSREQLTAIFAECTMDDFDGPAFPDGAVNVNTAGPEVLRIVFGGDESIADSIISLRKSRSEGIQSIVDLMDVRRIPPEELGGVANMLDVTSQVFTVTSRGIASTGQEVEIYAVLDRSTLPVTILEYREQ